MIRSPGLMAFAACLAAAAGSCHALADDEFARSQAGTWLVAPQNGRQGCQLTLDIREVAGGHVIAGAQACATALPAIAGARTWTIGDDGTLLFSDAAGERLVQFEQDEGSPWQSEEGEPMWLLPTLGNIDRVPTIESLSGTWRLQRPDGQPLCTIALLADKSDDGTAKMLPQDDCPRDVSDLKLGLWATEGFGLVLMGDDGTSLTFDMREDGSFEKTEEDGSKPLLLVRP